ITEAIRKLRNGLASMGYKYKQFEDKIADYERSVSALEKKLDRLTLKHKKVGKKLLDARLVKYADTVPKIAFKDIPISVRALNVLETLGVYYLSDLQHLTIMELLRARNLGKYSFEEVLKIASRSEEHTSELQSRENLVCRLLLEKKKRISTISTSA